MKTRLLTILCASVLTVFVSCKKEKDPDPGPGTPNGKLVRIQQGTDPDLSNDTVYILSYNAAGKISNLVDSNYGYFLTPTYDVDGRLESVSDDYGDGAVYTFDANGVLREIAYMLAGSLEKYEFTYSNGVVTKKSHYSDFGSGGALTLWRNYEYTVTNGNITSIKAYTAGGAFIGTESFTYGSQPNVFKDLALFNFGNWLGAENIFNFDTYFNKNLVSSKTTGDSFTNTYTLNAQQQLSKAVSSVDAGHTFTWKFTYQ